MIHVACLGLAGLSEKDRVTRNRVQGIKFFCNACSASLDKMGNVCALIEKLKNDISSKMESFETKISDLSKKLEPVNEIQSPVFIDNITNEAIDRIKRSKHIIIRGAVEINGTSSEKTAHDSTIVANVLKAVNSKATPITFFRFGKPHSKFPQQIKVVLPSEYDAKQILKNKRKLLETNATKKLSIIDDKTPHQRKYLAKLRKTLETRKNAGETELTIKYVHGNPKIVSTESSFQSL